jgi:hypothetical protein
MPVPDYDFSEAGLVGQQISIVTIAKLVEKGIISHADAADILDRVLLQLEQWQSHFPEYEQGFQVARNYLSELIDAYRAAT